MSPENEEKQMKIKYTQETQAILSAIQDMDELPVPNTNKLKLIRDLRLENVNIGSVIESIEQDQTLVAQIIKLVNSGYYSLRNSVDSVDTAAKLLGTTQIKRLVFSASIMEVFGPEEEMEWEHSYSSFSLMSKLMEDYQIPAASNLPLTMLMHDIGKVALRRFSNKKYDMVRAMSANNEITITEAENTIFKVNHSVVGGWLLRKWQMTDDIVFPIIYHHTENAKDDYILETALVQFVNWVDNLARRIRCKGPCKELMDAAGLNELYEEYWVDFQIKQIQMLAQGSILHHSVASSEDAPMTDTSTAKISRPN